MSIRSSGRPPEGILKNKNSVRSSGLDAAGAKVKVGQDEPEE